MLRNLFLSSLVALGFLASPAQSCSVHDQMCQFHGVGRAVNHTINQNSPTSVVIGTIGNNAVDFDNAILLPDGNGPYIASSLPIFDTNQPYLGANEQPRRVATGQYQVDFQNGTAQATHSGDFNGAAAIPNPPGCTIGTGPYCEEIRIIGNIPDPGTPEGFVVKQTNYLYNYYNTPNPSIDLVSYGAATGRAYFKQNSHLGSAIITDPNEYTTQYSGLRQEFLAGNKATGTEQTYYIGYDDFDAHAAGVVVHYDQTRKVLSSVYDVQFGHQIPNGTTQFSGLQRKDTIARFDRTYDFTQLAFADTGLPALHLNDQETARWNTWSDVYGVKENAGYTNYVLDQARISREQFERDEAAGCNYSGCSNLPGWRNWSVEGSQAANVNTYSRIAHPLSKNLYFLPGDDGTLYVQKVTGAELTLGDKFIYNLEIVNGALENIYKNPGEVLLETGRVMTTADYYIGIGKGTANIVGETGNLILLSEELKPSKLLYNITSQTLNRVSSGETLRYSLASSIIDSPMDVISDFSDRSAVISGLTAPSNDDQKVGYYATFIVDGVLSAHGLAAGVSRLATRQGGKIVAGYSDDVARQVDNLLTPNTINLQSAADSIQSQLTGPARNLRVTTVTQTSNGRIVVSTTGGVPTPQQRLEANRIFGDGKVEFVSGGKTTNASGATGHHAEQRAIEYLGDEGATGASQASSAFSCDQCVTAQSNAGVINVTGSAFDNGGVIGRPLDPTQIRPFDN